MIVCVCHRVSDREIARHAHAGMSFDEVQFELGVATQCGRCETCARDVHAKSCAQGNSAAIHNEAMTTATSELATHTLEIKSWNSCSQSSAA